MTTQINSAPATAEVNSDDPTDHQSGDQTGPSRSRRQVLIAAGLGAGTLTLAACGSSSTTAAASSTSTSSAATSSAAAPAAPASSAAAPAPASSAAAPASSAAAPAPASSAAAPAGDTLVALSKVPVAGAVAAKDASGKPIIVAQPTAGKAVAFSAICTHMGCPVAVAGAELHCPCHGSKYNALTGAVINGPATKALASVSVTVTDGNVVAG